MATPEVEFQDILPYAIMYEAVAGNYYHQPVAGQRATRYQYQLEPGVYNLQLSYTGEHAMKILWCPTGDSATRQEICQVGENPTGVPRSSKVVTVQAREGAYFIVSETPAPKNQDNPTSTASVMVFPIPA